MQKCPSNNLDEEETEPHKLHRKWDWKRKKKELGP